jgi:hypothetical protein
VGVGEAEEVDEVEVADVAVSVGSGILDTVLVGLVPGMTGISTAGKSPGVSDKTPGDQSIGADGSFDSFGAWGDLFWK